VKNLPQIAQINADLIFYLRTSATSAGNKIKIEPFPVSGTLTDDLSFYYRRMTCSAEREREYFSYYLCFNIQIQLVENIAVNTLSFQRFFTFTTPLKFFI